MQITESGIQLAADHQLKQEDQEHESLLYWRDAQNQTQEPSGRALGRARKVQDGPGEMGQGNAWGLRYAQQQMQSLSVEISSRSRTLQAQKAAVTSEAGMPEEPIHDLRMNLFKSLVERLTGRKIEVFTPARVQAPADNATVVAELPQTDSTQEPVGWGLAYDHYASHYEYEATSFSAQGVVKTADGREISIDLQLNMQREFYQSESFSVRAGAALKDPLVVNFAGTSAELTETKFSFDIDADGQEDQISFVRPGSGFLVLDRNGDGQVNDGSELFGPSDGDGFAELAAFDEDNNAWIDENDSVFNRLRVWTRDGSGQEHLMALGQAGIGALYLGHIDTPFLLKDGANQDLGQVRSSGLALHEDGSASVLQQLDLVV